MSVEAVAPGKVILLGEHFVVHGSKALSLAIDRYVRVKVSGSENPLEIFYTDTGEKAIYRGGWISNLDPEILDPIKALTDRVQEYLGEKGNLHLEITFNLPISAGLGSSASLAAAVTKAVSQYLGHELGKEEVLELASLSEEMVHGKPSGIDLSTVTMGGLILFDGAAKAVEERITGIDLSLLICDSGERRSTGVMVGNVNELRERYGEIFRRLVETSNLLVEEGYKALLEGDIESLGVIFNLSQGLLKAIGVSTRSLEALIGEVEEMGALGAKLTGAGGGGCIIALMGEEKEGILHRIRDKGYECFYAHPDLEGVRVIRKD